MSIKFIHMADLHMGVERYGRIDPSTGLSTRVMDFCRAFDLVVERAISEDVDFLLFCGDAYRSCDPSPTQEREFAKRIKRLIDAGIKVVMIVGNHDTPVSFGKATALDVFSALELPGVWVIRKPDLITSPTREGPVQIVGFPWPVKSALFSDPNAFASSDQVIGEVERICSEWIERKAEELSPSLPTIFAGHLLVHGALYSGSERASSFVRDPIIMLSTLAREPFKYVALGHIHRFQDLNPGSYPPVVYSGSLERMDFSEEGEEKGFCLVNITDDSTSYEFVRIPARPFVTIDLEIKEGEDPTDAILSEISRRDLSEAIVRVRYKLDSQEEKGVDMGKIRSALKNAHWLVRVEREVKRKAAKRRIAIPENVSLSEALDMYIDRNKELLPLAEELKKKAAELLEELERKGMVE
jgi:exonuclease SbcD